MARRPGSHPVTETAVDCAHAARENGPHHQPRHHPADFPGLDGIGDVYDATGALHGLGSLIIDRGCLGFDF